jgi:hypothetical protein
MGDARVTLLGLVRAAVIDKNRWRAGLVVREDRASDLEGQRGQPIFAQSNHGGTRHFSSVPN